MDRLALWANEVHFCSLFCGGRIIHRQKELPAFLTKFFQGLMFDIALGANDHLRLLKCSYLEPLEGVLMHFMCHWANNFSP